MAFGGVFHLEAIARRKLGVVGNENFHFYHYESVSGDTTLLTGCVCDAVYTSGQRKGLPKYDGKPMTAYVTNQEEAAEVERYEREEVKCARCNGSGKELESMGVGGTTYRTCGRCKGAGVPQQQAVSA